MDIAAHLTDIKGKIPQYVTLVAVSKTKSNAEIMEAYNAGQRVFGENRVHEMAEKYPELPNDIRWHMIGHLQSKKVKLVAPFVSMIQSVDSLKLLQVINREGEKNERVIDCLLQIFIATEESKYGLEMGEVHEIFSSGEILEMKNIGIRGVMGMATFTDEEAILRREFKLLKEAFVEIKNTYFSDDDGFKEISMGMSGDFPVAIEEGSTMVRIGSLIFGARCSV
jgi:pyridoxal phosphate enzyme (YggS family)